MKRTSLVLLALAGLAAHLPAHAQQPGNPIYFGAKLGFMDPDDGDEATNAGVLVGYTLMEDRNGAFAVEGEYTRTFDDGEIGNADWDIETLTAYLAYRTAGNIFLKAKAGYGWWDVNVDGGAPRGFEDDDWDFAFGAGVGYRLSSKAGLEVEYTVIQDDIDFLSLGFFTRF